MHGDEQGSAGPPWTGAPRGAGAERAQVRDRGRIPRARGPSPRGLDRLSDVPHGLPELLRPSGDEFVGLDNYQAIFSEDTLVTAIRNNVIWVLFVPAFVTAIGLVFAVLVERVRFSVAFKTVVFMPMAISLFAAGVIWRVMYEKEPDQGA